MNFIDADRFNELAAAIINLQPDPVTGLVGTDQVKIALAEIGNIWPRSIHDDPDAEGRPVPALVIQKDAAGRRVGERKMHIEEPLAGELRQLPGRWAGVEIVIDRQALDGTE